MNLSERLENVAVLGAAGKMGSGIALLLAKELAMVRLSPLYPRLEWGNPGFSTNSEKLLPMKT